MERGWKELEGMKMDEEGWREDGEGGYDTESIEATTGIKS